jgi:UDP-2,3-diacylglucosamine pyrophosphatase LpxH
LGGFDNAINAAIEHDATELVRYCASNRIRLIFHGHLFDYWMEYPGQKPPIALKFREAVKTYADEHGAVLSITGNHDNWMLGLLSEEGFDIRHEHEFVDLDGKRVLILHGDGLSDPAFGFPRPLFHQILRHPGFVWLYRSVLPFDWALGIMRSFSRWQRNRKPEANDTETLDLWAASVIRNGWADIVIAGHHHDIRHVKTTKGEYLNTGAFYRTRTVLMHTNGHIKVVEWDSQNHQLTAITE